ncbi:uncharacterized protein LOC141900172 [Tubulanus polymorphus]|uniref:uncharacterized protein LOC141900172 n=1 Tax=Tubulanus polymorphus TaxID=672921 RepID=UPI003DA2CC04
MLKLAIFVCFSIAAVHLCEGKPSKDRREFDITGILTGVIGGIGGDSSGTGGGGAGGDAGSEIAKILGDAFIDILPDIIEAGKKIVKGIFDKLMGGLFPDYYDDIITGRAVRIRVKESEGVYTATIEDRTTGLKMRSTGKSEEEAVEVATELYMANLIRLGILSPWDLKIPFTETTTSAPCGDFYSPSYCQQGKSRGWCQPGSQFYDFTIKNCYKTCSGC